MFIDSEILIHNDNIFAIVTNKSLLSSSYQLLFLQLRNSLESPFQRVGFRQYRSHTGNLNVRTRVIDVQRLKFGVP